MAVWQRQLSFQQQPLALSTRAHQPSPSQRPDTLLHANAPIAALLGGIGLLNASAVVLYGPVQRRAAFALLQV